MVVWLLWMYQNFARCCCVAVVNFTPEKGWCQNIHLYPLSIFVAISSILNPSGAKILRLVPGRNGKLCKMRHLQPGSAPWPGPMRDVNTLMSDDRWLNATSCDLVDFCKCPTSDLRGFEFEPTLCLLLSLPLWSRCYHLGQLTGVLTEIEAGHLDFCWHLNKETSWGHLALELELTISQGPAFKHSNLNTSSSSSVVYWYRWWVLLSSLSNLPWFHPFSH